MPFPIARPLSLGLTFLALAVAEKFPSARVIGTDLSPIQPDWSAPNVEFRVEDLEDELRPWTNIYTDADLIHIRAMLNTLKNPQRLLAKAFEYALNHYHDHDVSFFSNVKLGIYDPAAGSNATN